MKEIVGKRIRKLRESMDLTQENMASELGITPGAYAKIERGETDVSITRLVQITEILKVELTTLLKDNQPSPLLEELQNPYGYASKTDVENLAYMIRQTNRELEKLREEIAGLKKSSKKR